MNWTRRAAAAALMVAVAGCRRAPTLSYEISAEGPKGTPLVVSLEVRDAPAGDLVFRGYAARQVLRIEGFEVSDATGRALPVEERPETIQVVGRPLDVPRFVVHGFPGGAARARYRVSPGAREGDTHLGYSGRSHGYAGPEFVFATGRELFLLPHPTEPIVSIDVRFRLPGGWSAAVPWKRRGDRLTPDPGVAGATAAEHLIAAPVGLGRFREHPFQVAGTAFRLAFEDSIASPEKDRVALDLEVVTRYIAGLFGKGLGPEYLVVVVPRSPNGDAILGEGWGTGQGMTFAPLTASRLQRFAENLIDAYLRHAPHRTEIRSAAEFWLVDGLRGYYSWRAVEAAGRLPDEATARRLAMAYLGSVNVRGVQRDLERLYATDGKRRIERQVLAPFVLALLDHRINKASAGAVSLDAVVRAMFRSREAASLWATLPPLEGESWPRFREQYVRGGADLLPAEEFYVLDPTRPEPDPPTGPILRRLTLAYTGNTDGYLENCGCKVNQAGGVARRATVLARLRAKHPDLIVLDAGSAFIRPEKQNSLDYLSHSEQRLYLDTLRAMRYAAVAVATNELTFGADHFVASTRDVETPFLAANVRLDGQPLARPALRLTAGGLRVAAIGVFEPPLAGEAPTTYEEHAANLGVEDVLETLRSQVPVLARDSDLVIALGRLSPLTVRRVAREIPDLDMVISSEYDAPVQDGTDGELHVQDHPGFVGRLLVAYTPLTNYGLHSASIGVDSSGRIGSARFENHWLYEDVPDDARIRRMLDRFYDRIGREAAAQESVPSLYPDDQARQEGRYVGQARCAECHETEHRQWLTTRHADAYKTLLDRHRHFQPKCVACHVVGYGTRHGYRLGMAEQTLANVQCEACHGPGGEHVEDPSLENIRREVPESVCLACHNPDHSDRFVYAERLPKVRHDLVEQ